MVFDAISRLLKAFDGMGQPRKPGNQQHLVTIAVEPALPFAPAIAGTPRNRVALAIALAALVVAFVWHSLPAFDRNALPHPEPLAALATRSAMAPPEGADASASPGAVNANPGHPAATDARQPGHVDIDPAKVLGASLSQRADDARRMREAVDLADFGADLLDRALEGDADAAQALADLLRPRGLTSRVLDHRCISRTSGACGAAKLEAAYRYTLHPAVFERIQARRAELLARIRSGQFGGIFVPVRVQPGDL